MKLRALLLALFIILSAFDLQGQKSFVVEGIKFQYSIENSYLNISLEAPTLGWIGIGFNQNNSIVKSDLLLFHIVDDKVECKDIYVVGFGDPREDVSLGGQHNISDLTGYEAKATTHLSFRIPLHSGDKYDFNHEPENKYWVILAYSEVDDFGHPSRVRKHIPMTLIP